jgi:hypothetical protein
MRTVSVVRTLSIIGLLSLLSGPQLAQSIRSDAALFNGDRIDSSRPLVELAAILQVRYGKPIVYEDPVWEWPGDDRPGSDSRMAGPANRLFRLPPELTTARSPQLTRSVLERVLAEYHQQYPVPHYRIVESGYGLHLVPETARGASGQVGAARNVMETIITVEEGVRTASDHFTAICKAIGGQQGFSVVCSAIGVNEDWFEKLFAVPGGTLRWGAAAMTARDALADLLGHSATSFSWATYCDRKTLPYGAARCIVDLQYIRVARADASGNAVPSRLEFDRRKP